MTKNAALSEKRRFWKSLAHRTLSLSPPTPFYVFSARPIAERISELDTALAGAGFQSSTDGGPAKTIYRHWLSCKTQPFAPLLRWWRRHGRPIEVVSEFELRAALAEGFTAENILVNGPAKHQWLASFDLPELSVNFDSPAELAALLPRARKSNWRCGVRINTRQEFDPENPEFPTQFGFAPDEAFAALKKLLRAKMRVETAHFHLRTNVSSPEIYRRAIAEIAEVCRAANFAPLHLDIGGGLPVRGVFSRDGKAFDSGFSLREFAEMLWQSAKLFPGLREIWLENGRWVSAGSGALVMKILDVKERRGLRQLICDGGRTLNALPSLWERHEIFSLPGRAGAKMPTAIYGPTCMAFDQLARIPLPRSLRAGDFLVWLDAGAYHIPWETRFSHGHAAVFWHDESGLRLARGRQNFEDFWRQWK
jgi:diaminopimelate decarboxylase